MNAPDHWRNQDPARSEYETDAGPQGAALILELRRLQVALDRDLAPPPPREPAEERTWLRDAGAGARHAFNRTVGRYLEHLGRGERGRSAADAPAERAVEVAVHRLGQTGRLIATFCRFLLARTTTAAAEPHAPALGTRMELAVAHDLRIGLRALVLGVGVIGAWGALVPLSGAVVAPGTLVVESRVKKVQHAAGGIVAEIRVQDGVRVDAGDLIMRLDETQARANNQMLLNQLAQTRARIARLLAERDGAEDLPTRRGLSGEDAPLLAAERSLFKARAATRGSQKEALRSHVHQLGEQIAGFEAQARSKTAQVELIAGELTGVEGLYTKGLVPLTRMTTLQREAARLEGERGQIASAIAEARSKISEAEIQILRIDQDFRADVMKELREAEDKESELTERSVAASDLLKRIEIRAPVTGIVHELSVHTIGGVVAPGEVIMEIVPETDDLVIEARILPQDIDQVRPGQDTYVRLSAFNQRTTPQLRGKVSYVSADLSHDKQSNAAYYTVRVTLPASERRRAADLQLVAGMPAEVFLQTKSRTMLSYLLKPITDQLARMFNER